MIAIAVIALALFSTIISLEPASAQTQPVWNGQYYNNTILTGTVAATRQDGRIGFDWGDTAPIAGVGNNMFSIRWGADVFLPAGTYRFWAKADDDVAVTLDFGRPLINTLSQNRAGEILVADVTLNAGSHHIQVDYRENVGPAYVYVEFANLADNPQTPAWAIQQVAGAWTAAYYPNTNLSGTPAFTQAVASPTSDWGFGSPAFNIPADFFSARFATTATLNGSTYMVSARADDGIRVYVNGALIINEWHVASGQTYSGFVNLPAGQYPVVVEFIEYGGLASLQFSLSPTNAPAPAPTPSGATATVTAYRLNVRNTPDPINGAILTKISRGETYSVLGWNSAQTWVRLNVNGTIGWVNVTYVTLNNAGSLPIIGAPTPTQPNPTGYSVIASPFNVNIRTGPGTQFNDIGDLSVNQTAIVVGRNSNSTWWQINFNGIVGWVSAQYARIQAGANINTIPITG
jgi:uncharacterized protein YraI